MPLETPPTCAECGASDAKPAPYVLRALWARPQRPRARATQARPREPPALWLAASPLEDPRGTRGGRRASAVLALRLADSAERALGSRTRRRGPARLRGTGASSL